MREISLRAIAALCEQAYDKKVSEYARLRDAVLVNVY